MNVVGPARRAARKGASWWWRDVRPSTGLDTSGKAFGDAAAVRSDGGTPAPTDRLPRPRGGTGPWADIDPDIASSWPSRAGALAGLAAVAGLGTKVWRELRRADVIGSVGDR